MDQINKWDVRKCPGLDGMCPRWGGRNLNVELQSCWLGYAGGVCKRLRCQGLGGCQPLFAQRGQWRGSWEPVNLICISRGTVEQGHWERWWSCWQSCWSMRLVALSAQRWLFSDHLQEISHKKLFKKVIQVCLEEQCFCGAGLALPFASSLSVVTLQDQQQDCQGQC